MTAAAGSALVVGGSRGIGRAVALRLAETGRTVVVAGRSTARLETVRNEAADLGLDLRTATMDAEDEGSVARVVAEICRDRAPDVLVNAVGQNLSSTLVQAPRQGQVGRHGLDPFVTHLLVNTVPAFLCTREVVAALVAAGRGGVVVNVSSAVHEGAYGQSAYAAGKAALNALTRTWALELARYGIRVVGVAPGVVEGQALTAACLVSERHRSFMTALRERIPARRFAREDEVADAVVFCVGNEYLSGTTLRLDGGGLPHHS